MSTPLVLLGQDGDSTRIVYNRLRARFGDFPAVIEEPVPRSVLLRVRRKKLGLLPVISQLAFMMLARPVVRRTSAERVAQIKADFELDTRPLPADVVQRVPSVNADAAMQAMLSLSPRVVLVNGTRIIARRVLQGIDATFINTHVGITPAYRGAHGAYWALRNNDRDHCGVTVHLVDPGIDTGDVIGQAAISPQPNDTFITYPYLQIAAALPLIADAVASALAGELRTSHVDGNSAVWYHPGLLDYLWFGVTRQVW